MSGVRWSHGAPFSIIPEWLLDAEISDRAVRVFGILARYADRQGQAIPSRKTLATRVRCSISSIDRALDELVALGAVTTAKRHRGDGSLDTNEYVLHAGPDEERGTFTIEGRGTVTPDAENESHRNESPKTTSSAPPGQEIAVLAEPELPISAPTVTAQTLVGDFVDLSRARGVDPPRRTIGAMAKAIGDLLREGRTADEIRAGLERMLERRVVSPALLANMIVEATLTQSGPRRGPGGAPTPEEMLERARQLDAEGR